MYVAYNPFYIPELGQVEKRNASPDRSHNETWDAVVINGFLGLAVYLALYSSVFYFGLKWIGLIADRRQYGLFWGLLGGGAALGTAAAVAWRGFEWFGLGLPIGMLAGVVFYLLIITAFFPYGPALKKHQAEATMAAIMLFAALSAHFFEINFGIAIVSTRTHFWVYTAVMFVLGMVFSRTEYIASREAAQPAPAAAAEDPSRAAGKKSAARPAKAKRKRSEREGLFGGAMPGWAREMFIAGGLVGIILGTLGYLYLTNARRTTSALEIVVNSLTQLPNRNFAASYGLLALVLTAFAAAAVLLAAELYRGGGARRWWQGMGIISATAWGLALLFWLWNAGTQAALAGVTPTTEQMVIDQVGGIAGIMTIFYVFFLVVIFALGALLPEDWPAAAYAPGAAFIGAVGLVAAAVLINVTNLRIIHADITYKMADPFTRGNQWPVATLLYKQAIRQAPDEDFYYLFLGRSYLEQAKLTQDPAIQTQLVQEAERDLVEAQGINPLNTDHTANLARLFSYWATTTTDPKIRMERALRSNQYYRTALTLSPNNSTLLGEWAILNLDILNDPGEAFRLLTRAIELDPMYNLTQNLMGNYYVKISQQFTDTAKVNTTLEQAAFHYNEAYNAINSYTDPQIRINSLLSLADVYRRLNRLNDSISSYELALQTDTSSPNTWRIEATIAQLYVQLGDKANAQRYVDAARLAAPPDQVAALDALGQQIQAMP
jgi:tetratricopeptide (TPR) repeat protein